MAPACVPRSDRGVSLLEILVSLIIIATLTTLTIGALQSVGGAGSLREATDRLASGIYEGQARALASGAEYELLVSRSGWQLSTRQGNTAIPGEEKGEGKEEGEGESQGKCEGACAIRFPRGVFGEAEGSVGTTIRFFPSGVVSPRTFFLRAGDRTARITISLRGRITVRIE